jgi:hypothetical protein
MLDAVFTWLRETLEKKRTESLTDYITIRCTEVIKDRDIWVPIYRTYSSRDFLIGDVQFRTISKSMMDRWCSRIPEGDHTPEVAIALNRDRSSLQGTIAARVHTQAESGRAREIAHAAADEAVALLRFLSQANWTCRIVSHCLPIGKENVRSSLDLVVDGDEIKMISRSALSEGPSGWNVDEARRIPFASGLLEALHELALSRHETKFRSDLYGALQLHARSSVVAPIPQKIVFVVAAAESLLLKNASEPIQKDLGERMAFLIGQTLEERKKIVRNVDDFYKIRSGLIHHGREVLDAEKDIVDSFFFNVWFCLTRMVAQVDQFNTRNDMFEMLENRKLS